MDDATTHPLKAWRLTQRRWDHAAKRPVPLTAETAARENGVTVQAWHGWEKWPEEGGRIPGSDNLRKIYSYTQGAVRPDHFHRIDMAQAS